MKIDEVAYQVPITFAPAEEFIKSVSEKQGKKKKHKSGNHKQANAILEATSLEGYSFEGWKRFFMEAVLYIEQKYYHTVSLDLASIEIRQSKDK